MDFNGKWVGEYIDQEEIPVPFEAELVTDQNGFKGICLDHYEPKVKSQISGFVEEGVISFVKIYEDPLFGDDEGNLFVDKDGYHPGVNYYGRYDTENDFFQGTWEIELDSERTLADEYKTEIHQGIWWMKRI